MVVIPKELLEVTADIQAVAQLYSLVTTPTVSVLEVRKQLEEQVVMEVPWTGLQGSPITPGWLGSGGGGWYGGSGDRATGGYGGAGAGGSSYIGNVNGATGGIGLTLSGAYWENGQPAIFSSGGVG
jgi:hypothetical protein